MNSNFDNIKLRQFIGPGFGLVFNAPASWQDTSDHDFFRLVDSDTGAQFTASALENPGVSLQQWADKRLSIIASKMSFLSQTVPPCELQGVAWKGIVAEYQGVAPGAESKVHYLVLCLRTDEVVVSFTITSDVNSFVENEKFYKWLLTTQLDIYKVRKIVR